MSNIIEKSETSTLEAELLPKILAGDMVAAGQLFAQCKRRAHKAAYGITHNFEDAQDAVQDAWMWALQNLSKFEGHSGFCTWLVGVARNKAHELVAGRIPADREVDPEIDLDDHPDAEEELIGVERDQELDRVIGRLPPVEQLVLTLKREGDVSAAEVARLNGLNVSTVEKKVAKAMVKVEAHMKKWDAGKS